jgi:hypothetical protein
MQALLRRFKGSIKALLRLYITALLRRDAGSMKREQEERRRVTTVALAIKLCSLARYLCPLSLLSISAARRVTTDALLCDY